MAKSKTPAQPQTTEAPKESKCPISREQFRKDAKPLVVVVDGKQIIANAKEFSTGSLGWYAGDKVVVTIDGVPVKVQVGINLTVVGSKDLPK